MELTVFEIERQDQVATLWLDNPDRRNAMGPAFWQELPLAMTRLTSDEAVRAIVIAARGPHFTAGLDLAQMGGALTAPSGGTSSAVARRQRTWHEIQRLQASITAVADCPKPVLAAVHGACIGGGVDLITACDIRLASAEAVFSVRETRIAIVADVGTLQRLPGIVGRGMAAELALTGDDVTADRAREIGLVNAVYPDRDALLDAARGMAARIAANSPLAVQGTKQVLRWCEGKSVADGLQYVAAWNAAFFDSEDLGEAMQAFFEKRPPRFSGQ